MLKFDLEQKEAWGLLPTQEKRAKFWGLYEKILASKGMPFTIIQTKQWAAVNRSNSAWSEPVIMMDFLVKPKILRSNVFLLNDVVLYDCLLNHKADIERSLGFSPHWVHGKRGKDTYRIKIELSYNRHNADVYSELIEKSFPIVLRFISTFRPYIRC